MYRSIYTFLIAALTLNLVVVNGIDVSQYKNVRLDFQSSDSVDPAESGFNTKERTPMFIGDLVLGKRYADETIFRRVIELENPTDTVQSTTLNMSVSDGSIHYISVRNVQGSYAVICDQPNALGGKKSSFNVRLPSNSQATLTLSIAAHNYLARSSSSTYHVTDKAPFDSII